MLIVNGGGIALSYSFRPSNGQEKITMWLVPLFRIKDRQCTGRCLYLDNASPNYREPLKKRMMAIRKMDDDR
jgi:hypothetical protein